MRKHSFVPYLILSACILAALNIPFSRAETLRGSAAYLLSSFWNLFATSLPSSSAPENKKAVYELENTHLRALVQQELLLLDKLIAFQNLEEEGHHKENLSKCLQLQLKGIPGQVVYRTPEAWSSSCWINIGMEDNQALNRTIICKDSPVLSKGSVIGVIDYVGKHQSRIRLITDSGLTLSVRAARGGWRDSWLSEISQTLFRQLSQREDIFASAKDKEAKLEMISQLVKKLADPSPSSLLAKGELKGSSAPLWRSRGQRLKGIGFNYDFADEEGPARDLRTGIPEGSLKSDEAVPLLKIKDLLITTGYEGIFPPGLPVAEIVKIFPLKEGDYCYDLEAIPAAGNLDEISHVLVLPPYGYDKADNPPLF